MSFKKTFLKNLLVSGSYTYLSQLINFTASLITSRLLLPSDFGLVGLITVFSGFVNIFLESGIGMAVIRSPYQSTFYRGLHAISVLTGIASCITTLLVIYPVSLFYSNEKIILPGIAIAILFILRSFTIVPVAVLQKKLQFNVYGKILVLAMAVSTLSTIIMAYYGFQYWSLIWGQFINAAITIGMLNKRANTGSLFTKKKVLIKTFQLARTLIGRLTAFNILNYWARNADNLIVGKYYGTADLGIYNRAYLMLQLPLNLSTGVFNAVLFPSLVKHKNEGGNIEREYYFILKTISFINLPIALVLIMFPQQFVSILWGENWLPVAKLLPYFGLMVMIQTLISTLGSVLVLENKEKVLMIIGWTASIFIIAAIIFGSTISLVAIAAFYSLAYIILVLPLNIFYGVKSNLHFSGIIDFWIPKILLCLLLWFAIYNHQLLLTAFALCGWIIMLVINSLPDILKARVAVKKILKSRRLK